MSSINEREQYEQEKAKILEEIYEEVNKIKELEIIIRNNFYLQSEEDPILEQVKDCESLHLVVKDEQAHCNLEQDNAEKEILRKLDQEKTCLEFDLTRIVKLIQKKKESIFRAQTNMEHMKAIIAKSEENNTPRIDNVLRNVHQRFKAEKRDFRLVIETLFPDNIDLQDLIAKILDHYFQEGQDKYLQLDYNDGIYAMIETLIQTSLFEKNPNDDLQIKLANLL